MKRITACLLGVLLLVLSACGTASPAAEPTASRAPTAETTATPGADALAGADPGDDGRGGVRSESARHSRAAGEGRRRDG